MLKKLVAILIINTFTATTLWATGCSQPVFHLLEGQPAACEGYLFSVDKEKEVRQMNDDYNLLLDEDKYKDEQIVNLKARLGNDDAIIKDEETKSELWRQKAEDSTAKYIASEDARNREALWYVLGGVALTVLAGYAVGQVAKASK